MTAKPPERLTIDRLDTPIGVALLATDEEGYLRLRLERLHEPRQLKLIARYNGDVAMREGAAPAKTREALTHFDGELNAIKDDPQAHQRHQLSARLLAGPVRHPGRSDGQLRRTGRSHRQAQSRAPRRPRQRQPDRPGGPLPPGDQRQQDATVPAAASTANTGSCVTKAPRSRTQATSPWTSDSRRLPGRTGVWRVSRRGRRGR